MTYRLNGKTLRVGKAFVGPDGIQYPSNWLSLSTPEEKAAIGIEEVAPSTPYDSRFYYSAGSPRPIENVTLESGEVQVGLRTDYILQEKDSQNNILSPTDFYVIRNAFNGKEIPAGITSFREAVVAVGDIRENMIGVTTTAEELRTLMDGSATEPLAGFTTTILPQYPNQSDYHTSY